MISWPDLGTRVTLRYRRPPSCVPPLTDAIGHLLAVDPLVRIETKTGTIVEVAPADVVAVRALTDKPVRTADIRDVERAAAAATAAAEHIWLDGWLLRADPSATLETNSALPLDISSHPDAIPEIAHWYRDRGLTPRLAVPDRLLTPPPGLVCERTEQILLRDKAIGDSDAATPDGIRWLSETRAYLCVSETDPVALARSLGFRLHHRRRYFLIPGN